MCCRKRNKCATIVLSEEIYNDFLNRQNEFYEKEFKDLQKPKQSIEIKDDFFTLKSDLTTDVQCPDKIFVVYKSDVDIVKIHEFVKLRFCSLQKSIHLLIAQLEKYNIQLRQKCIPIVDRNFIQKKRSDLEKQIQVIQSNEAWDDYVNQVKPLLIEYIDLNGKTKDEFETTNDVICQNQKRIQIIKKFIDIASKYIEIEAYMHPINVSQCTLCGIEIRPSSGKVYEGFLTSSCECGKDNVVVASYVTYRDSSRIDIGSRNNYEDIANFIKRIDAFEGKQKIKPPEILYTQLNDYFVSNCLTKDSAVIRSMESLPDGKKEGTSIALLVKGLLETQNSSFYKDIELIAHRLWGWKLADITTSGLRDVIVSDYIITQKTYNKCKERESSVNVNLRLPFHLKARGYPCSYDDFKIVSSKKSIDYHSRMFKIMAEENDLDFEPF